MAYFDHFKLNDDLILHLDSVFAGLGDPFLESRYVGFLSVSSVTVLELALKSIFCDFAISKHKVLGSFCSIHFEKINGRIGLKSIQEEYLKRFGLKYQERFKRRLNKLEADQLKLNRASVKSSFGNLIVWRNEFSHEGRISANATYIEVKKAYGCGKLVMDCLAGSLNR